MMIKCQKCGFENQMGSIFCRECGEKLDMDAIDPNKLQKDVNKEKNIKRAKKRIKEAISTGVGLLLVAAFIGTVFYNGGLRKYEEPAANDAAVRQKFNNATNGTAVGKVKYTYAEVNKMLKTMIVDPLSETKSFAKATAVEVAYDEAKNQPVVYLWVSIKDKVPVTYTIHGDVVYNVPPENAKDPQLEPITLDVGRLDIGRLPIFLNTQPFLNGFTPLIQNEAMTSFFARAKSVEFSPEGMTVDFAKGGPTSSYTPPASSNAPSGATAAAALKGGSVAVADNAEAREAARAKAEEKKRKAEEAAALKKEQEEERKRKIEEYNEKKKQEAEERKRKQEEERARKQQEKEERERQIREENERRRQEREDRRRDRENNNYNSRNNRSSRSSRNNRW